MKLPYVVVIDEQEVPRSYWHNNCKMCDYYLSFSMEEQKQQQADWISSWYRRVISTLMHSFIALCRSKDVDEPNYFPGRHWLSDLKDKWEELFPDSDILTYHQICADVLTILGLHLFFFDLESPNIEKLHDYLIDNYETARTALARIATNMKALELVDGIIQSEKGEMPNEDGLVVYYYGKEPSFVYMGGPETELKWKWRKILPGLVSHIFEPYIESQSNEITTECISSSVER